MLLWPVYQCNSDQRQRHGVAADRFIVNLITVGFSQRLKENNIIKALASYL